jgi:hypothetical protein
MSYKKNKAILEELFYTLTVSLVVFNIMELARPRLVLAYLNLNYLLLVWLILGIILLKTNDKKSQLK